MLRALSSLYKMFICFLKKFTTFFLGIILKQVQKKDEPLKQTVQKVSGISPTSKQKSQAKSGKNPSPRETKASALRKLVQLNRAASSEKPKNVSQEHCKIR